MGKLIVITKEAKNNAPSFNPGEILTGHSSGGYIIVTSFGGSVMFSGVLIKQDGVEFSGWRKDCLWELYTGELTIKYEP